MSGYTSGQAGYNPNDDPDHNKNTTTYSSYDGPGYTENDGHLTKSPLPPPPKVPQNGNQNSSGRSSVDTSALKVFADNLDTLAYYLGDAREKVEDLKDLEGGAFKEAEDLKKVVTGTSDAKGLRENLDQSLHDIRTVLMDTAKNIRTLTSKYSSIEEINQKAGSELETLIDTAESELTTLGGDKI